MLPVCCVSSVTAPGSAGQATPLQATKGYGAPEVEQVYARVRELCEQIGKTSQLFPVLRGLCGFYLVRAEHRTAHELAEQLLHLAQSVQDPALFLEAHHVLGQTLLFLGELAMAREHLEQGIALYDPQQHRAHTLLYGQDPGVVCLAIVAWALWFLGYPGQALKRIHQALTLAQELSHSFLLAYTLNSLANVHLLRREEKVTQGWSETLIALSSEQGFPHWGMAGTIRRGWALAEQGQREEGIAQICQGLAAARTIGTELTRPYALALLAEAYGKTGQTEEGLITLAEALAVVHKTGEC